MNVEIKRWGNSQGIRIPKNILNHLQMHEGDVFELESVEEGLLLKPSVKSIDIELFEKENQQAMEDHNRWTEENGIVGRKYWDY